MSRDTGRSSTHGPCASCADAPDFCDDEHSARIALPRARLRCASCENLTPLVDALGSLTVAELEEVVPDDVVNAAIALFQRSPS